jgi:thiamine biosynthesis lipoprotein
VSTTAGSAETAVHRRVEQLMGMPISLALRGRHVDDRAADEAWQRALEVLREVDRVFSTYRADSFVSRLDRGEIDVAGCPPEVAEVIALGEQARRESGGAFDVLLPGPDGLVHLDPSGVVKGWAVERAAVALEALPGTDFCLSAGGDLVCRTKVRGAAPWRIGIEDPHDPASTVAVVPVLNGAVATSGLAHRGAHIVDPRSGRAATGLASVTVVGPDLTWADIDATAAFALGLPGVGWLEERGRQGLVVLPDGTAQLVNGNSASGDTEVGLHT